MLPCRDIYAVPDTVLLHRSATSSRRDMIVSRNSLTRYTAWHLRIRRLVQFIFVGAIYHNALTICAALLSPRGPSLALWAIHLVPRLRRAADMCSSKLSDTADRLRHGRTLCAPTEEKILCRSPFRSGRWSLVCARLSNKGRWSPKRVVLI